MRCATPAATRDSGPHEELLHLPNDTLIWTVVSPHPLGGLLLTALTLIFGTNPAGYGYAPRLWLGCCGIYLQPSEPLKFLLVVYLAAYLADRLPVMGLPARRVEITRPAKKAKAIDEQSSHKIRKPGYRVTFSGGLLPLLAPTLVMTGLSLLLLLIQRDLGTATIFLFIYFAILYVATGRKEVLLAALLVLEYYHIMRLLSRTFLTPFYKCDNINQT